MQRASRGQIFSWTLFDFANTGFHIIIVTFAFQLYFKSVIGGSQAAWGFAVSASMLITALIGPLLGSIADATNRKKRFLALFTAACVASTAALYFTGPGTLVVASLLFIIANVGFEGGIIFYDAFLPELVPPTDYGRVSGYGFAMGYVGSFIALALIMPILMGPQGIAGAPITFPIAAAYFGLFSLPLFLFVPERGERGVLSHGMIRTGYARLRDTITHLRRFDSVKRFLLAFFIYNDSILTVIVFAATFASDELRMDGVEIVIFLMVVQGSALVGSLIFGQLTNRLGARQSIVITLAIWTAIALASYFVDSKTAYYVVGVFAGIALGSSQSSSRALMALLTPPERKAEFFGFYDGFFGKASAVVGPAVFGLVSSAFDIRIAMLVIGFFFLVGIALILRVPDVRAHAEV